MKTTLIVNLFAGPGTGKSTTMAGIFSKLKWKGVDCEMAPEYAKEKVWEESPNIPTAVKCQGYVFGQQLYRLFKLNGKVDIVITDSPLLLALIYAKDVPESFTQYVLDEFNRFNNLNIFLDRTKKFNPNGRLQTEDQARDIDKQIEFLLMKHDIGYRVRTASEENIPDIALEILNYSKENT